MWGRDHSLLFFLNGYLTVLSSFVGRAFRPSWIVWVPLWKVTCNLWIYFWARCLFCLVDLSCSFSLNDSVGISASLAASHPFLRGWSFLINGYSGQPRCGFLTVAYLSTKCRISLMDDWQEFCRWTVFYSWMTSVCSDMRNLVSYIPFHCNLGHGVMLKRNTYEGLSEHRLQSSPETSKSGRTVDWLKLRLISHNWASLLFKIAML